jgi:hypothetical protein
LEFAEEARIEGGRGGVEHRTSELSVWTLGDAGRRARLDRPRKDPLESRRAAALRVVVCARRMGMIQDLLRCSYSC